MKYLVIMDRIKTALDCIKFYESNEARLAYLLGYMQNHIDACYYLIGRFLDHAEWTEAKGAFH